MSEPAKQNLQTEILAQLEKLGWIGSNALLQRCPSASDKDQVVEQLHQLIDAAKVQQTHGKVGMLYALHGVAPLAEGKKTGAFNDTQTFRINSRDAAPKHLHRQSENHRRRESQSSEASIEQMITLFRAIPLRANKDFQLALGLGQARVAKLLREMSRRGLIEQEGQGRDTRFRWVEAKPEEKIPPLPLGEGRGEGNAGPSDFRCALFSDGSLELEERNEDGSNVVTILRPEHARVLRQYLGRLDAPGASSFSATPAPTQEGVN